MRNKYFAFAAIVASLHSPAALALPFPATPEGFASHLNQMSWDDGKSRVFSGLGKCHKHPDLDVYSCNYGYVQTNDPVRGSIFCEIQEIQDDFNILSVVKYKPSGRVQIGPRYPCRQS